jgi:hypothetical protein
MAKSVRLRRQTKGVNQIAAIRPYATLSLAPNRRASSGGRHFVALDWQPSAMGSYHIHIRALGINVVFMPGLAWRSFFELRRPPHRPVSGADFLQCTRRRVPRDSAVRAGWGSGATVTRIACGAYQ